MHARQARLKKELRRLNRLAAVILLGWTFIIAGNLTWDLHQESNKTFSMAVIEARANFNKDKALRFWAALQGGVYVPANDFDLLITDLTMPALTGTKRAQRVNRISPDFPIILCTGQQDLTQESDYDGIKLLKILHKPDLFAEMAFTLHQYFTD